ncbi:MAG: hypothetical protein WCK31_01210 [bacterium]
MEFIAEEVQCLLPFEKRSHEWFLQRFENSLSKMSTYSVLEGNQMYRRFQLGNVKIIPEKLTAVAIKIMQDCRFELLIGNVTDSGYGQGDHEIITCEYDTNDNRENTFSSIFFSMGKLRFLMTNDLDLITSDSYINQNRREMFVKSMKDYNIHTVFLSVASNSDMYVHPSSESIENIVVGDFSTNYDKLIFSDYSSHLAIKYSWSNFELIHFRMTSEVPNRKITNKRASS